MNNSARLRPAAPAPPRHARGGHRLQGLIFLAFHGLLVAVALLLCAQVQAAGKDKVYAVVVAHNGSVDPGVRSLKYADDDGARYWEFFSAMTDEVHLLTTLDAESQKVFGEAVRHSRPPTRAEVVNTIRKVQDQIRADKKVGDRATLFVVFAGHGAVNEDGMGYLSLLDGAFTRAELLQEVVHPDVADRTHLIIDACNAYFMVHERGDGEDWKDDRSGETLDNEFAAFLSANTTLSRYPRVGVLLSTAGAAEVHEWSQYRSGVFSHEVRSGLLGAADINGDKAITYLEIEAYLEAANTAVQDPRARIHVFTEPPQQSREEPMLNLSALRSATLLEIAPGEPGRYHISDSRGVRYADFHTAGDHRFYVALLQNADTFFVRSESLEARLEISPGAISLAELDFVERADGARGAVQESYRANLYAVPYGQGFYAGFHAARDRSPRQVGVTAAPPEVDTVKNLDLRLGYLLSAPQFTDRDLGGLQHNLELGSSFWFSERLALEVLAQYGTSGDHFEQLPDGRGEAFRLHRVSFGLGLRLGWNIPGNFRVEVAARTAHQFLWADFPTGGAGASGSRQFGDPFSWRSEGVVDLNRELGGGVWVGARLGVSLSLLSSLNDGANQETLDPLVMGGAHLGYRF